MALSEGSNLFFNQVQQASAGAWGPLISFAKSWPWWLSVKGPIFFNLGRQAAAGAWGLLVSFTESLRSWLSAKDRLRGPLVSFAESRRSWSWRRVLFLFSIHPAQH
jgi:hypothetical protein